jgi:hypothetical protein
MTGIRSFVYRRPYFSRDDDCKEKERFQPYCWEPKIDHKAQMRLMMNQLSIKDKMLEEEKKRADGEKQRAENAEETTLIFKELLVTDEKREFNHIIYIATSHNYANQNRFKVGGVSNHKLLKRRLSCYNGRSASGDEWYFTYLFPVADFTQVENRVKDAIGRFRDKKNKEIYVLHYFSLVQTVLYLCQNYNNEVKKINKKLTEYVNLLHSKPFIPDMISPNQIKTTTEEISLGKISLEETLTEKVNVCNLTSV